MTIRYQCEECASVLKIRDELAGTVANCPKCKTSFTIPHAESENAVAEIPAEDDEDPVDMPQEVTPRPNLTLASGLSPGEAMSGSGPTIPAIPAGDSPKPSIAELMREHEATKKKKKEKKQKGGLAEAAAAAEVVTSGTAADALTRNYDQKRGKAGEPPPMTREERRASEQRTAMLDAGKKIVPIVVGGLIGLYFLISWMLAEPLPDLEDVSGVVTVQNVPLANVQVIFLPVDALAEGSDKKLAGQRNSSAGYTDASGHYVLKYDINVEGALVGVHSVRIVTGDGVEYTLPSSDQQKTVSADGENIFNFSL